MCTVCNTRLTSPRSQPHYECSATAANPENGTTSHYYNADGTLDYKTDAKGQKLKYIYDSLQRVTMVQRYPNGTTEDTAQRTEFQYDGNSVDPTFSQNVAGRLALTTFSAPGAGGSNTFYEMYSYDSAGRLLKKRLRVSNFPSYSVVDKDIEYNYTGSQLTTVKYPDVNSGIPFTYYYDNMSRPNRMTGGGMNLSGDPITVDWINSVNYNNVNQRLTSFNQKDLGTTNFTYNERNELTAIQAPGTTVQYEFSATADNGQILSRTMNGEKVAYQYDTLKRLVAATATVGATTTWAST